MVLEMMKIFNIRLHINYHMIIKLNPQYTLRIIGRPIKLLLSKYKSKILKFKFKTKNWKKKGKKIFTKKI